MGFLQKLPDFHTVHSFPRDFFLRETHFIPRVILQKDSCVGFLNLFFFSLHDSFKSNFSQNCRQPYKKNKKTTNVSVHEIVFIDLPYYSRKSLTKSKSLT